MIAAAAALHFAWLTLCLGLGLAGMPGSKRLIAGLLGLIGFGVLLVLFVRARTPWYMTFWFAVPYAALPALVLSGLAGKRPRRAAILASVPVLLGTAIAAGYAVEAEHGQMRVPATALYDVRSANLALGDPGPVFPALHARAHGHLLCGTDNIVLHGPYATAIDTHVGLEALLTCGQRQQIRISGSRAGTHYFGYPCRSSRQIGLAGGRCIGSIYVTQAVDVIRPKAGLTLASGNRYPPRGLSREAVKPHAEEFNLAPSRTVAVTGLIMPVLSPFTIGVVTANGKAQEPVARLYNSQLFRCINCKAPVHWRVEYKASRKDAVEIVSLR